MTVWSFSLLSVMVEKGRSTAGEIPLTGGKMKVVKIAGCPLQWLSAPLVEN